MKGRFHIKVAQEKEEVQQLLEVSFEQVGEKDSQATAKNITMLQFKYQKCDYT